MKKAVMMAKALTDMTNNVVEMVLFAASWHRSVIGWGWTMSFSLESACVIMESEVTIPQAGSAALNVNIY
jgi:hypothetical protein